jgi:hypothetical protein
MATPFQIDSFRSNFVGDGARPNLFQVIMVPPTNLQTATTLDADSITFMAKAAQLPGSTVGTVSQYYFGREMKFAGNRTFADWTITVINDESFKIRNAIEEWMNAINGNASNVRNSGAVAPLNYTTNALINQYSKNGVSTNAGETQPGVLKSYNFYGMFPVDISPIDVDWGTNDTIEEFTVTFAYQYWTAASTS